MSAANDTVAVATIADERAAADPRGRCLADERTQLNNAAFAERVRVAAATLAAHGLGRGDVLAVMLPNRVELVVALFAAWRLGAAVTPLNPKLTRDEARHQLTDAGAEVAVVDDAGAETVRGIAATLVAADTLGTAQPAGALPSSALVPDDVALLIYTSGTTGRPKGVMLTHANVAAMTAMWKEWSATTAADRCLLVLPLFHVNALLSSAVGPLLAGASTAILSRFDPVAFWAAVEAERPTYVSLVPTIVATLAALPEEMRPDTSSLRYVVCGAAPASAALLTAFERRYGAPVVEGYGLSECTLATAINPIDGVRKPGTVGPALPGAELRVVAPDGRALGAGEEGEVEIRGPHVMQGYLRRREETAQAVRDGWLRSGDLGTLDADGYLTITGRIKDLIIRGGANISPKEVEDVLTAHPAVFAAALVGAPDERLGEVPVAFAVLRDGAVATEEELIAHCATALAPYKRPASVRFLSALPLNDVGKVVKAPLRELLAEAR
jgi:long-chain acyl-CoA synthetase